MLIYVGKGAFIVDIPARDLTDEEVKKYGKKYLLKSGLYVEPDKPESKEEVKDDV